MQKKVTPNAKKESLNMNPTVATLQHRGQWAEGVFMFRATPFDFVVAVVIVPSARTYSVRDYALDMLTADPDAHERFKGSILFDDLQDPARGVDPYVDGRTIWVPDRMSAVVVLRANVPLATLFHHLIHVQEIMNDLEMLDRPSFQGGLAHAHIMQRLMERTEEGLHDLAEKARKSKRRGPSSKK